MESERIFYIYIFSYIFPSFMIRFQCYDKYALADLAKAAQLVGHPEWSQPPSNAGFYNSLPYQTQFFSDNQPNNYASSYGNFFLGIEHLISFHHQIYNFCIKIGWYSHRLIEHGANVMDKARDVFQPLGVQIAGNDHKFSSYD